MHRYAHSLKSALEHVLPDKWAVYMPTPPAPPKFGGVYSTILFRTFVYPVWARKHEGDINHVIDHSYGHLLYALNKQKSIVTVHDIAPLHFQPRGFGLSTSAWKLSWRGVQSAKYVMVDSKFIQYELSNYLTLSQDNYFSIPLGISPGFQPTSEQNQAAVRSQLLKNNEFMLLHVGHMQARKNLPVLFHAISLLRKQGIPVKLIQIGGSPTSQQIDLIQELQIDSFIQFIGKIPADDHDAKLLSEYYSAADLFIFPSLYEGFGMPVVEAMACGTAVVASRAASLPEVVGDAGLLADPSSPEQFANQIRILLTNKELRESLIKKGFARAKQFSWENTAKQTLTAYQSILTQTA